MKKLCNLAGTWGVLLGRLCLAAIFLQSGIDKLFNFDKAVKLMASKAMPMPEILLLPAIVILLAGGAMLLAAPCSRCLPQHAPPPRARQACAACVRRRAGAPCAA